MDRKLNIKEESVLTVIIESFIRSGEAVSSAHVANLSLVRMSPATVRNICQKLSDHDYIEKKHSSSGRLPTYKGLKYYVEFILSDRNLSNQAKGDISTIFSHDFSDTYSLLVEMSELLSFLVKQLGIIVVAQPDEPRLFKIEAIPVTSNTISLVLIFDNGHSKSVIFKVDHPIPTVILTGMMDSINQRLTGLTLSQIRTSIEERLRDLRGMCDVLFEKVISSAYYIFSESKHEERIIVGKKHIDQNSSSNSLNLIEVALSGSDLIKSALLSENYESADSNVYLHIDSDGGLCLVSSRFKSLDGFGVIGVVGTKMMPYNKVVPLLDYAAKALTRYFD